jgi:hypothetical protein
LQFFSFTLLAVSDLVQLDQEGVHSSYFLHRQHEGVGPVSSPIAMEPQCHLSKENLLPSRAVVHHVEAYSTWREWIDKGVLHAPFTVIHVDAHSDLGSGGLGNTSPKFIETELMALPIADRRYPRLGPDALNSGNYLLGAIANEWIQELTYVYPADPDPPDLTKIPIFSVAERLNRIRSIQEDDADDLVVNDLPGYVFKGQTPRSGVIQLKGFSGENYLEGDFRGPISVSNEIPFKLSKGVKFDFTGFTHVIIAQSPAYTPATADRLLPIIREYFTPA